MSNELMAFKGRNILKSLLCQIQKWLTMYIGFGYSPHRHLVYVIGALQRNSVTLTKLKDPSKAKICACSQKASNHLPQKSSSH